jgi:hypothetical protein
VPELKIQEGPPSTLKNINGGPWEVPKLKIRERPPSTLINVDVGPPGRTVNGCRNLGTNAQIVVRTYFNLTQIGYFCWRFSWGLDMPCVPLEG